MGQLDQDEIDNRLVQLLGHELRHAEQAATEGAKYLNTESEEEQNGTPYQSKWLKVGAFESQNLIRIQYEKIQQEEKKKSKGENNEK